MGYYIAQCLNYTPNIPMKHFNKKRGYKTTEMATADIKNACDYLVSQKDFTAGRNAILSITLTDTGCKHEKDLNHKLTTRLFNTIKNDYKNSGEHTNYIFVIEYPEVISKGKHIPSNCKVHTHIVLNTSLPQTVIENYIVKAFSANVYMHINDITNRNDRLNISGYLIKQGKSNYILSADSYNYKISINERLLTA